MRHTVIDAIQQLPSPLKALVSDIVSDPGFDATLSPDTFKNLMEQSGLDDKTLRLTLLPVAAAYSIAPLSNFHVGAIVRGESGRLYFGANMEFSGVQMGQTIHAEQSAISHAWIKGEKRLKDITINYSPCGHCRQFMNELDGAELLTIQLPDQQAKKLHDYLPESFGPKDLGIETGLLADNLHGLKSDQTSELASAAVNAANRSHAPYSGNVSGVAIQTHDRRFYTGMYAENAAFNPSLPPLQVALIALNMADRTFNDIAEVMLVEKADSPVSHLADTQATLEEINPDIPFHYQTLR